MKNYSNNNGNPESYELIGYSPFTYYLRCALRHFGIHIHNDFLICLANLPFNLNYNTQSVANSWLLEYIPEDILGFLSVATGITLMNNELPQETYHPFDIEYPILVFAKWDNFPYPCWGMAEKILDPERVSGVAMNHTGLIKESTSKHIIQVIVPELSSFLISYEDIIKTIGKNALKYLGYSGPVFSSGSMYGVEFFQIWMEGLDENNNLVTNEDTARFCSTIANNSFAASKYFNASPNENLKEMGILFENLSELISPFGKGADIKFILETEKQKDLLMEAITRTKEIYLLIQPELEALV